MELSGECGEDAKLEEYGSYADAANAQSALYDLDFCDKGEMLSICDKQHPPLPIRRYGGMTQEQGFPWLSVEAAEAVTGRSIPRRPPVHNRLAMLPMAGVTVGRCAQRA